MVIKEDELPEIAKDYGDERRTEIMPDQGDLASRT